MESISSAQEFQDTLIYGPAYGKSERRVQTIFHVCKILMRKQFQNHGRHGRSPGLAVRPVGQHPSAPRRIILRAQIRNDLGLDVIGHDAAEDAVLSIRQFPAALADEGVDGQSAYDRIIWSNSGISVEGQ